jgi:hypothetical protein
MKTRFTLLTSSSQPVVYLSKMTVIWLKSKNNHQQPENDVAFPYRLSENDNVSVLKAYAIKNGLMTPNGT